jgi:hypothetical protein
MDCDLEFLANLAEMKEIWDSRERRTNARAPRSAANANLVANLVWPPSLVRIFVDALCFSSTSAEPPTG